MSESSSSAAADATSKMAATEVKPAAKPSLSVTAKAFVPNAAAPAFVPGGIKAPAASATPAAAAAGAAAAGASSGNNSNYNNQNRNIGQGRGGNRFNNAHGGQHVHQQQPYMNMGMYGGGYPPMQASAGYYPSPYPQQGQMMPQLPPGAWMGFISDGYSGVPIQTVFFSNGTVMPVHQYMQMTANAAAIQQQQQQQQQQQMQQQGSKDDAIVAEGEDSKGENSKIEKEQQPDCAATVAVGKEEAVREGTVKEEAVKEEAVKKEAVKPATSATAAPIGSPTAAPKAKSSAPAAAAGGSLAAALNSFAAVAARRQFTKQQLIDMYPKDIKVESCPELLSSLFPSLATRIHPAESTTIAQLVSKLGNNLDASGAHRGGNKSQQGAGGGGGGGNNRNNNNYYQNKGGNNGRGGGSNLQLGSPGDWDGEGNSPFSSFGNRNNGSPVPTVYKSFFAGADKDSLAELKHEVNSCLNKLSATNFEKISDKFIALGFTTRSQLKMVVDTLVRKAQMEEHFCFMYADLCKKMIDTMTDPLQPEADADGDDAEKPAVAVAAASEDVEDEATSKEVVEKDDEDGVADGADGETPTQGAEFRQQLLNRCRDEFEFDRMAALEEIQAIPKEEIDAEERLNKELSLKKRFTGQMRFIGEMFMKDIISPVIMNQCLTELIECREEEELKCLCKLFETIGAKLEAYYLKKSKSKKNKDKNYESIIPNHFENIKALSQTHSSSRARFMLKDLMWSRDNGWISRLAVEKVVDLSETRGSTDGAATAAATAGKSAATGGAVMPQEAWNEVQSTKKKKAPAAATAAPAPSPSKNRKGDARQHSSSSASASGKKSDYYSKQSSKIPAAASAVPSGVAEKKEVAVPSVADAAPSKDVVKKVVNSFDEYYTALEPEEPLQTIQELVHPNFFYEIVTQAIIASFERKQADRDKLCTLLDFLVNNAKSPLLTNVQVTQGVAALLEELDDFAIDSPKAASYCARIVGTLAVTRCISLKKLFVGLDPDTSNFAMSMRAGEFLAEVVSVMQEKSSTEEAAAMSKKENLHTALDELLSTFPENERKAQIETLTAKHNVPFLASN